MVSQDYLDRHSGSYQSRGEMEPAGFWLRAFAWVYDAAAVALLSFGFYLGLWTMLGSTGLRSLLASWNGQGSILVLLISAAPFILWCAYHVIFEASSAGATPGKLILGIRVLDLSGDKPSLEQVFRRTIWKQAGALGILGISIVAIVLSWLGLCRFVAFLIPVVVLAGLFVSVGGYLMAAVTIQHRALHDLMSDCVVVIVDSYSRALRILFAICAVVVVVAVVQLRVAKRHASEISSTRESVTKLLKDTF